MQPLTLHIANGSPAPADLAPPAEGTIVLVADLASTPEDASKSGSKKGRKKKVDPPVPSLVYTRTQLAAALSTDLTTFDRWCNTGRFGVQPLRMGGKGGKKLFSRLEVEDYLRAGCPPAKEWDARQAVRKR